MKTTPPHCRPLISSHIIIGIGLFVYILTHIWPPLLLLLTVILSRFIPYALPANNDAETRRKLWKSFEERNNERAKKNADLIERYWVNSRGMCLMTYIMLPKYKDVKGVVCFCHGFKDNCSFKRRADFERFTESGMAVIFIEYEGHGRSDGVLNLIHSWDLLIDDVSCFFQEAVNKHFPGKKCFLAGESMGGAVAYSTYIRNSSFWNGVVFFAPMLKVSDEMLPPAWVVKLVLWIAGPLGTNSFMGILPVAPTPDVQHMAFRVPEKLHLSRMSPSSNFHKIRLATGREMLGITAKISKNCKDFDAPFIILHGASDKVTDPKLSQIFYDESISKDKEIKFYKGMWHALTNGETNENIEIVFNDALSWIMARV